MSPLETLAAQIDAKACESILADFNTYAATLKTVVLPELLGLFQGCPKDVIPEMPLASDPIQTPTPEQAFSLEIAWRAKCRVAKSYTESLCDYDRQTIRYVTICCERGLLPNGNPIGRGAAVKVARAFLGAIHEATTFQVRDAILEIRSAQAQSA